MSGSDTISPTAHYTGYVWARNGLSHPALVTAEGRRLYSALAPLMRTSRALSGACPGAVSVRAPSGDRRRAADGDHRARDHPGDRDRGRALAPRLALCPALRRRDHLHRGRSAGHGGPQAPGAGAHRLASAAPPGPRPRRPARRRGAAAWLSSPPNCDPDSGLVVITEGLTGYLSPGPCWAGYGSGRGGRERLPAGRYVSDLHLGGRRRSRSASAGACCRRSCAAGSTCTSPTGVRLKRRCATRDSRRLPVTPARPPGRTKGRDGSYT